MEATSIQLFVLNQRTLTQWFNRTDNNQELSGLTQGLTTDDRIAVTSSELPALREPLGQTPSTSGAKQSYPQTEQDKLPSCGQADGQPVPRRFVPAAPLPDPGSRLQFLLQPGSALTGAGHPSAAPVLAPPLLPPQWLLCLLPLYPAPQRGIGDAGQRKRPLVCRREGTLGRCPSTPAGLVASQRQKTLATAASAGPHSAQATLVGSLWRPGWQSSASRGHHNLNLHPQPHKYCKYCI
ncbi:uncharacterized protein LOC122825112 [Gambusia affinis]|uniref:uncharacterized protein LOC122825112 n=1 Tax=Gambusia affinis TaxID=33528 RepID=UPI001CDBFA94|nr:uncharacterized protein LOC122825112 [Gambusia affinis]